MKFLDLAGVQQFKDYNDSKYVVTEDVADLSAGSLDFYTKDEIDEILENFDPELTETDPVFTASAASGITSSDISNWNSKTSNTGTITGITMNGASKGTSGVVNLGTVVTSETDPVFSASAAAGITSSDITNWNSKTDNVGTITGITMNGASKGTSGVVNLGTVLTSHQDISGKADKSAAIGSLSLSLDSTNYKITLSGTKVDGTSFTVSNVIDLPLESVVVNGSYNNTTKKVVLTLQNGNTVDFSVADLVSGLQSEITSTNKLSADLISDGTTNKTVTATEKSTWNGKQDAISDLATIRSNAEAGAAKVSNVQSDWNANSGLAQILNKPTIPAAVTESTVSEWGFTKNTGTYSKPSGGIPSSDLDSTVQTSLGKADTAYQYPSGGIPKADLSSGVKVSLGKADTAYQLPSGGIPATDLDSSVQTSLGKADTALQSFTEADPVFSASAAAGITSSDITNWNNKVSNVQSDWNATSGAAVILNKPTIPSAPGTLKTNNTTAQTASASEALSGTINLHKVAKTGTYSDLIGTPTIPSAPGTLKTNNTTAQSTSASEDLSGTINLHQVSKTGNYYDLATKPRIFTGTCTIAAGTQAKTVTCASYDALTKGDIVFVTFSYTNTHATPTLNVNSKGAKSIKAIVNGALVNLPNPGALYANETIEFQYDGTYWVAMNTDTTPANELPSYSSSNNGQILSVVNGALAWITPSQIYSGSGTPSNGTGNNGDIYLQTS